MWLNLGVALLVLIIFFLATFVVIRNNNEVNNTFAIFAYTIALWIVANFIGANYKDHAYAQYFIRGDFFLGPFVAYTFFYFTVTLLKQSAPSKLYVSLSDRLRVYVALLAIGGAVIGQLPLSVRIKTSPTHTVSLAYNNGYAVYAGVIGVLLLAGLIVVGFAVHFAQGRFRQQTVTISRGLVTGVVLLAIANLLIPQFTNASDVNLTAGNLSYIGIIAFIVATSFAIVRHRLFDLRFFVVRATAYIFSVTLVTVFYLVPSIWIISMIVGFHITRTKLLALILVSLALTIFYSYLRSAFDRLTSRMFFRNYYDPEDVLHSLSELLVRTINVSHAQDGSKKILLEAIKASSLDYWLDPAEAKMLFQAFQKLPKNASNLTVLDEIEESESMTHTLQVLREHDVAVVIRLRTTHGELGYMTLGFKESGQPYTAQDKRLLSTATDEIAICMQNALHFEEIQQFNLTLQAKVVEATNKLRRTNDKLKSMDETKDDFISMASHQLRTPLTSVKGYLSMVLEGDAGKISPTQREMLGQAFFSSQRMVYLIADLLNVSRLKTGKFVMEESPVNLADIVEQEMSQLRETAAAKKQELTYVKPANYPTLLLDETKTRQVIMNFMDNAIYYTQTGGHIEVKLNNKPGAVELLVIDDGMGVPRAEQHYLFTKFYRAGNARRARPDGTGLGLYMAKKVIMAQDGAIIFESKEGKGSTFGFTFSKSKQVPDVVPAKPKAKSTPQANTKAKALVKA